MSLDLTYRAPRSFQCFTILKHMFQWRKWLCGERKGSPSDGDPANPQNSGEESPASPRLSKNWPRSARESGADRDPQRHRACGPLRRLQGDDGALLPQPRLHRFRRGQDCRPARSATAPSPTPTRRTPERRRPRPGDRRAPRRSRSPTSPAPSRSCARTRLTEAARLIADAPRVWCLGLGAEEALARIARTHLRAAAPRRAAPRQPGELGRGPGDDRPARRAAPLSRSSRAGASSSALTGYARTTRMNVITLTEQQHRAAAQRYSRLVIGCHAATYARDPEPHRASEHAPPARRGLCRPRRRSRAAAPGSDRADQRRAGPVRRNELPFETGGMATLARTACISSEWTSLCQASPSCLRRSPPLPPDRGDVQPSETRRTTAAPSTSNAGLTAPAAGPKDGSGAGGGLDVEDRPLCLGEAAGQQEPDRDRCEPALDRSTPRPGFEPHPGPAHEEGEQRGWAEGEEDHSSPQRTAGPVADRDDHHHVRLAASWPTLQRCTSCGKVSNDGVRRKRLQRSLAPHIAEIEAEIAAPTALREKPARRCASSFPSTQ